jgi:diaminopimelate epimerase
MKIPFVKMHGAGNDYVYVDATKIDIPDIHKAAIIVSDRHFGIGSDGLILICPSDVADYKMRMFNLDGTEGKMCGNGVRCVAKFVYDRNMVKGLETSIETLAGIKYIDMFPDDNDKVKTARVNMGEPIFEPENIPTTLEDPFGAKIPREGVEYEIYSLSMGNPHCVIFVDNVKDYDIDTVGALLESDEIFPDRCNIEFVEFVDEKNCNIRIFERGCRETLSCGTGICAAAVTCIKKGLTKKRVNMHSPGGTLTIEYDGGDVFMTGPCEEVFTGEIEIDF